MGRKRTQHQTNATVMIDKPAVTLTLEEDTDFAKLRISLAEINKIPGVKGYLLRNTTSAVIDLQEPAKLIEYALLSSEAADACVEISNLFNLKASKIVVEGSEMKMISMILGENRLSIFTEKNLDHSNILEKISS